jgi:hypothetical protein
MDIVLEELASQVTVARNKANLLSYNGQIPDILHFSNTL